MGIGEFGGEGVELGGEEGCFCCVFYLAGGCGEEGVGAVCG